MCNIKISSDIKKHKARLSEIVGVPVEVETFKKINSEGVPETDDPGYKMQYLSEAIKLKWRNINSVQQAQKTLKEFEKENSEFIKYLEEFLKSEVSYFRHKWPGDEFLCKIESHDFRCFLIATKYLLLKIQAFPRDKKLVQKTNQQILRLEQWLDNSALSMKKISEFLIEKERLETLEILFAYPEWTTEELLPLAGKNLPDISKLKKFIFVDALVWESLVPMKMVESARKSWILEDDSFSQKVATFLKNRFNLYAYTFFRDSACKYIAYACIFSQLPEFNHDFPAQEYLPKYKDKLLERRYVNMISCDAPHIDVLLLKIYHVQDYRRMYLAAVNIRDYWMKHGKLPDDPVLFKSDSTGHPVKYDKLKNSFILTIRFKEGNSWSRLFKLPPQAQ